MASILSIRPGDTFSRLTALSRVEGSRPARFLCQCACGVRKQVVGHSLLAGGTKSCGCLNYETRRRTDNKAVKHGEARRGSLTRTYEAWADMRDRVASNPRYAHLTIDPAWEEFSTFKSDMGERPAGKSLDRIDGSRGYGPDNCRWATRQEQQRNVKSNVYLTANGERKLLIEWAEQVGIHYHTLRNRVRAGWPHERAIFQQVDRSKSSSTRKAKKEQA